MDGRGTIPVLTGCTASGKTGMLLDFQAVHGDLEVVNADSRQVYTGMDIGTAKPTVGERALLPHHLVDRISPGESYSAGMFAREAENILEHGNEQGRRMIVAGGTVLYILALTGGLDPMPGADAELRSVLNIMESERPGTLNRMLSMLDPERASELGERDTVRHVRALEVLLITGSRPSSLRMGGDHQRRDRFRIAAVTVEREELRERVWKRTRTMLDAGLLDEVSELTRQGWGRDSALGRTIGYREVLDFFDGTSDRDGLAEAIAVNTWKLARRQLNMMGRIRGLTWIGNSLELNEFLRGGEGQ